jgi:uncharacterized membrane protein YeaQ/YmgE (transglycosylase-associated protein family)
MFSFVSLISTIIIGGIAGLIAGIIRQGRGYGIFWSIIIGIFGGGVGSIIFNLLGFNPSDTNLIGTIIVSVIGSLIVLAIININN